MTQYNARLQWILVLVVTTTSQAPCKELLEQLELTSDIRKALKLSAKSRTDDKWKQHNISTSGLLPWSLPRVQKQYPLQASSILRHYANGYFPSPYVMCTIYSIPFFPYVVTLNYMSKRQLCPSISPKVRTTFISIYGEWLFRWQALILFKNRKSEFFTSWIL